MAFTEAQILAGGGMIANQPYKKPNKSTPPVNPANTSSANYQQGVNAIIDSPLSSAWITAVQTSF